MALVQKTIGNTTYYTDNVSYFTFHIIKSRKDPLYLFASQDLGINKTANFTPDEAARINDLAGTNLPHKTKYLLLKMGEAIEMPYRGSVPDINPGDIILRRVNPPTVGMVKCPHCSSTVPPGPICMVCQKPLTS